MVNGSDPLTERLQEAALSLFELLNFVGFQQSRVVSPEFRERLLEVAERLVVLSRQLRGL